METAQALTLKGLGLDRRIVRAVEYNYDRRQTFVRFSDGSTFVLADEEVLQSKLSLGELIRASPKYQWGRVQLDAEALREKLDCIVYTSGVDDPKFRPNSTKSELEEQVRIIMEKQVQTLMEGLVKNGAMRPASKAPPAPRGRRVVLEREE